MTLIELKRLLEAQKSPHTVEELCQMASAMALVSIAIDLDSISTCTGEMMDCAITMGRDIDLIEKALTKIEKKIGGS